MSEKLKPWPKLDHIERVIDRMWKSGAIKDGQFETTGHIMQYAMLRGLLDMEKMHES